MRPRGNLSAAGVSPLTFIALASALGALLLTVPFAAALISLIRIWDWNLGRIPGPLIALGPVAWLTLTAVALVLGVVQLLRRSQRGLLPGLAALLGVASLLIIIPLVVAMQRSPSFRLEPSPPLAARTGQSLVALEVHGFMLASADGGATWAKHALPPWGRPDLAPQIMPWRITFSDSQRGWLIGKLSWDVFATADGGATWSASEVQGMHSLSAVTSSGARHVWAGGRRDKDTLGVAASSDGGATWAVRTVPGRGYLSSLAFADSRHGWGTIGRHHHIDDPSSYIIATSDGGRSWRTQYRTDKMDLGRATFADARHGWVTGTVSQAGARSESSVILATKDGGASWKVQHKTRLPLLTLTCTDRAHVWAAGREGRIIATSDGGRRWREQASGTSKSLEAISFSDPQHGWILAERELLLATSDGGASWTKVKVGPGAFVIDIASTAASADR